MFAVVSVAVVVAADIVVVNAAAADSAGAGLVAGNVVVGASLWCWCCGRTPGGGAGWVFVWHGVWLKVSAGAVVSIRRGAAVMSSLASKVANSFVIKALSFVDVCGVWEEDGMDIALMPFDGTRAFPV